MSLSYGTNNVIRLVGLPIPLTSISINQLFELYSFLSFWFFLPKNRQNFFFMSTSHPIALQLSTYPNTQLVVCINPLHESKQDILPTPLITPQTSSLYDNDHRFSNDHSQELIHRLCHQRSRLTRLYDLEIERQQSTSQLITFLNKIDQLLNEYECQESTNIIIGNYIETLISKPFIFIR
jgi:hypothetical protein